MKIRKRDLVRIINGEMTISEARQMGLVMESVPTLPMQQTDPTMYENDSVDMQVDKFLLDADPAGQETQQEVRRNRAQWLHEGVLDEEEGGAPPAPTPDAGGASPAADPASGKPQQPSKKLDLVAFASDVARLVEKSDNLLDVKGAIVRRALNYVSKNYDPKQAKDIAQILENNFGVSAEPGSDPYDDESAPNAVGAGPGLQ